MELNSKNCDINDVFDNIVLCEESLSREGYEEGYRVGSLNGEREGYHLGYHRGAEVGSLVGYYRGFVRVLSKESESKVRNNVLKLKALLDEFPSDNNEDADIVALLDSLKGLYKIICTQLKISPLLPDVKRLTF